MVTWCLQDRAEGHIVDRERLCDQLHFMRETDDGQAHLGFLLLYVSPEIEISEATE